LLKIIDVEKKFLQYRHFKNTLAYLAATSAMKKKDFAISTLVKNTNLLYCEDNTLAILKLEK
jgi:hypothetical protein